MLIDVTERAWEASFRIPVAVTAAAWADVVEWPETEPAIQDESGRLCDILFMASVVARAAARLGKRGRITFELCVVPRGGEVPERTQVDLHVGPGDRGEPVATIMEPGED
ncbi:hypothetical protein DFR29_1322 [Tahibacter aquaticus]|uniref:Uncharacterized protein n=1 Tax=Tahibacter aquaticus TaxID=520092 RepID=A0A4R6YHH9_9GAMM|nr:DUF6573 family protein [Tahibacter aquaticus]TDR36047.1 hypothetical protein DFR29_1322 [Tahibacter aquaticus]